MAKQDYPNSAVAFVNDRDRKSERDPHLKGSGSLDCPHCGQRIEFWLSVWSKVGAKAGTFLSLSLRPKNEAGASSPPSAQGAGDDAERNVARTLEAWTQRGVFKTTTTPPQDLDETFPPRNDRNR
jgi:hypothetical protein